MSYLDGAPDRGEDPEDVIVDIGKRLDKGRFPPFQIGIQFVQIGVDDEAAAHLRKLDDDLKSKHKFVYSRCPVSPRSRGKSLIYRILVFGTMWILFCSTATKVL